MYLLVSIIIYIKLRVLWRREILEVIPRMDEMNRFKVVQLDEFDDYVGEPPNAQVENDIQKIEEK